MAKERTKAELQHELELMDLSLNTYKNQAVSLEQRLADVQASYLHIMEQLQNFWAKFSDVIVDMGILVMKIKAAMNIGDFPWAKLYLETLDTLLEYSQEYFASNEPEEIVNQLGEDVRPENIFF